MMSQIPLRTSISYEIYSSGLSLAERNVARADFTVIHARLWTPSPRGCWALDLYALARQNCHNTTTLNTPLRTRRTNTRPLNWNLCYDRNMSHLSLHESIFHSCSIQSSIQVIPDLCKSRRIFFILDYNFFFKIILNRSQ